MNLSSVLLATTLCVSATALAAPVRYAEDRSPGIVNPIFATTMSEARLNELVFEGLYTDNDELASKPQLAKSASVSPDKMAVRITLRDDVQWHDGTSFTSADVVFTVQALQDKNTASPEAGRVAWIDSVKPIDKHTVEMRFVKPEFAPQDKLHFKILPAHLFNGTTVSRTHTFRNRPIGTGPYAVVGFNDDNSITLQRHRDYWGEAKVDEFMMREVADKNYQAKLLIYESIETLVRVLPRDLATLQNDRKVELYPYQTNSWWYVGFNNKAAPFEDPRVRQALTLMVDVPELLAPIGTGDIVSGPFVPSSPFYNHQVKPSKHNSAKATELLKDAGYTNTGRAWVKDGRALQVRLATLKNVETAQDVLINLQTQLQNEGVQVVPEFLNRPEWKQRVWSDQQYDMILSQWSFDRNEDIYEQFHSGGARNFVGYKNEEVDELLDKTRTVADPQEKKALLRQVHAKIAADHPMIFLWTLDSYSAMSTKVQNVVIHPFYFFTFARDWSVQ